MKNIEMFESVLQASRYLAQLEVAEINKILASLAHTAVAETDFLLSENKKDLVRMDVSNPKYDRLELTAARIKNIADDILKVTNLSYPVGKILEEKTLPNGLNLKKITVPLGVVGIIYEARPNVTFDCFALCFKSGNATILKGGTESEYSNLAVVKIIHQVLLAHNINPNVIQLMPANRESTEAMLNAIGYIDVLIPRGGKSLIDYVRNNAKIPVIETGAGVVHIYFDQSGDTEKGTAIINNAKTRRVSVCNALDCLIIHQERLLDLPQMLAPLVHNNVVLYADQLAYEALENYYPKHLLHLATDSDFGIEFIDYKMAIKTVDTFEEAIVYINDHTSHHSEGIISENLQHIELFFKVIDASALYANSSTAFTDGAQFGLGAEIGISTQKLHARGPMGLAELTSYKWLITGNGQIRP